MTHVDLPAADHDRTPRERALQHLRKRRDFYAHLVVYAVVNGFLTALWAVLNVHGFFWPIFPMLMWGIGLVLHAWDVFRRDTFSEEQIQRQIERLQRQR